LQAASSPSLQIEGRVRGVGSEFVLASDMRFATRESAIFGQF
jgi:enoyl-CoA hydratase/carnithine racemase